MALAEPEETILVVDDTSIVLAMTQAMLERGGYRSISAASGTEALRILEHARPTRIDLVLLDLVMKDMSGLDTALEIRRVHPALPIVFMTGFPEQDAAAETFVLRKPFTSLQLIRAVRAALDKPRIATAAGR